MPPFAIESAEPKVRELREAVCANKLVDDAVVEKKLVEVAFASVTFALNVFVPVQVLFEARSDVPVTRQLPPTAKQPAAILTPPVE